MNLFVLCFVCPCAGAAIDGCGFENFDGLALSYFAGNIGTESEHEYDLSLSRTHFSNCVQAINMRGGSLKVVVLQARTCDFPIDSVV